MPEGTVVERIGQLPDGRMIWATAGAVLVHDGNGMETIPLPPDAGQPVEIEGTADGRILVTCSDYAGVARFDSRLGWQLQGWPGARKAINSFKEDFKLIERDGVLIALNQQDGSWFDGATWQTWPRLDVGSNAPLTHAYWPTNRSLYRLSDARTLHRLVGREWKLDRTLKANAPHYVGDPHEDQAGNLLIVKPDGKLTTLTPDGEQLEPSTAAPDAVGGLRVAWLNNGSAAVRSLDASIRIQDARSHVVARVDRSQGLPIGDSRGLFVDNSGRVWTSLGERVAFIDFPEHITRFDRTNGLETGEIITLVRHQDRLYAGTGGGVYQLIPGAPDDARQPARFERVPGIGSRTPTLLVHDDHLLAGHADGVSQLGPEGFSLVSRTDTPVATLVASPFDPARIYVGTSGGARSLRKTPDGWVPGETRAFRRDVTAILEFSPEAWLVRLGSRQLERYQQSFDSGSAPHPPEEINEILLTPMRIPLFGGFYTPENKTLPGSNGAPLRDIALDRWGDTPLIITEEGLFSTDPEPQPLDLLDPDTRRSLRENRHLRLLAPSSPTRAWIALQPTSASARLNLDWQLREVERGGAEPLRILPAAATTHVGDIHALLAETAPDGENILWVGGENGLLRVRLDGLPPPAAPSMPRLRSTPTLVANRDKTALTVPPGGEAITFTFASPENTFATLVYRSRLQLDGTGEWTPYQPGATREINFPGHGDYVLEVQARNADGLVSPIATLRFTVPPPWWLRTWTIVAGVAMLAGVFVFILQARSARLRGRQRRLEALVDERTAALRANERQLIHAKNQAEQANRAKSTFLAAMSHELRTPLNAILGFAQILRREDGLSPKGHDQLAVIDRNGQHLLGMINEVLDLSKIEAGKMSLNSAPFSLRAMASGLAETFQLQASERGLDFRLELGAGVPARVIGDESKLRQVLINLLANAIEHTPAGEIVLSLGFHHGRVRFTVIDTGKGIAAAELETIFEPFRQARPDETVVAAASRGSGLGLPISRRLVGLMGGVIQVESEIGRGSRFYFDLSLPVATDRAGSAPPFRITGYHGPRRRILIVDDIETNRAVLKELLTLLGFDVAEASTGEAALAAHHANPADLVLLDLQLPDLNGRDVARALLASDPRPRLIAVSASVLDLAPDAPTQATACDDFVPKPVAENLLLESISRQLHLEWTAQPLPPGQAPADHRSPLALDELLALELPAPAELTAWLELARSADLRTLRARLAAADPASPGEAFRRELDHLAARFRTGSIREILAAALRTKS
ncbi:MAG: ATP-binding protein [Verrucomicrobiota bacterium]